MPFSADIIYFVANEKLQKSLEKDPVLNKNWYWIQPGTLEDVELPGQGLYAILDIVNPDLHASNPYFIPWDAIWSKKRQKVKFYQDPHNAQHPPKRMLERIQELVEKCNSKAFFYSVQTHGGTYMHEYAWIFNEDHLTVLDEYGSKRKSFLNGKKNKLKGDILYHALKGIGVKTKSKTGWFEPHTSAYLWRKIRISPPIDKEIQIPPFPTSLHRSLELGDMASVKNCIANGLFPKNTDGLLEAASSSGDADLVELMLRNGVTIKNWWQGPLNLAKNEETVELLLNHGAEINHKSNPLAKIAESGNKKVVKFMISQGASTQLDKDNSLWFGACKGGILFLVKQLAPSVDLDCEYIFDTGLSFAAANDRLKVVKWLIENGATLNQRVLTEAAKNGATKTVNWLLNNTGLQIDDLSTQDDTALYEAANNNQLKMVNLLLERGANPHLTIGFYNFSAIHAATFSRSIPIVKRLLKAGVSIDAISNDKRTPLWIAVSLQDQKMVDFLIREGASLDLKGGFQTTFEEMAISKGISLRKHGK